jgi:O-antigen/teichoic acid export membrane protein
LGFIKLNISEKRSKNYIRQLKGSAGFKIGAILASFLTMPLMINYLGSELFGIWATMLTLVSWIMLFDLGIGNGLRNRISEALATNDINLAFTYISTSYVVIGFFSIFLLLVFSTLSFFIPWDSVFNTKLVDEKTLLISILILAFFVFMNFWLSLVLQIFHGLQKSSFVNLGQLISNGLVLFLIFLIYSYFPASLISMVVLYGSALLISNTILSYYVFKKNPELKPRLSAFDKNKISDLLSLGMRFFVIQVAVLVIFMSDKMVITQLLGPDYVTGYEVVFKLYSIFTIFHGMILIPLWPAFSNAYAHGDFNWIRNSIKKQLFLFVIFSIASLCMILLGPYIVNLWIGTEIKVDKSIFYFFSLYILVSVWSNIFAYFVNSINRINLQVVTSVVAAFINIPLSVYFIKRLDFGVEGVVLATAISLSIYAILGPIQTYHILKKGIK